MPPRTTRRSGRAISIDSDDPNFIDAAEEAEHRSSLLRRARELGISGRLALRADAKGFKLEDLAGVEFYKDCPCFPEPPALDEPLRLLIDMSEFTRDDTLAWLYKQGQVPIHVERDDNDRRLDRTGKQILRQNYGYNGIIWPVIKSKGAGTADRVPWPIYEQELLRAIDVRYGQFPNAEEAQQL